MPLPTRSRVRVHCCSTLLRLASASASDCAAIGSVSSRSWSMRAPADATAALACSSSARPSASSSPTSSCPATTAWPSTTGTAATWPVVWLPISMRNGLATRPLATTVCTISRERTTTARACGPYSHGTPQTGTAMPTTSSSTTGHRQRRHSEGARTLAAAGGTAGWTAGTARASVMGDKAHLRAGVAVAAVAFRRRALRPRRARMRGGCSARGARERRVAAPVHASALRSSSSSAVSPSTGGVATPIRFR